MIETETTWNDSGYDCDHCGGQILERTDRETGQAARVCFQCEVCGCQWQISGDVLRIGKMNSCRRAQSSRIENQEKAPMSAVQLWVTIGGGILLLLGLVATGGLVAIRFLIPVGMAAFVFWAVYRTGKERMWW